LSLRGTARPLYTRFPIIFSRCFFLKRQSDISNHAYNVYDQDDQDDEDGRPDADDRRYHGARERWREQKHLPAPSAAMSTSTAVEHGYGEDNGVVFGDPMRWAGAFDTHNECTRLPVEGWHLMPFIN
jgi:hypothetical protein